MAAMDGDAFCGVEFVMHLNRGVGGHSGQEMTPLEPTLLVLDVSCLSLL